MPANPSLGTAPRRRRALSIRGALSGAVAVLSMLTIAALGWHAAGEWRHLAGAEAAREADQGANRYVSGLFEVLMERLATNNALQAPDPAGAEVLQEIARRRAAVAANFVPGLQILSAREFPGRARLLSELRSALDHADDFRRRADEALRLPRDRRDEVLRRDYIPTITASVNAALAVWFNASHAVAAADPVLARLAMVKEIGWRMRDIAGFERSNIASAIAARQPVGTVALAANATARARVDLLWEEFGNLAPTADPATHTALRAAVAMARREYFQGFRQLADDMVKAGAEAGRYPMEAIRFVETTTPQLGTLLAVMHAAGQASEAWTAALVADAKAGLALVGGLLLLALAVAGGTAWLVTRRVTRPLQALAATTAGLAAGQLDTEVPGAGRGDEVGVLADALLVLRDGALRSRRLEAEAAALRGRAEQERRDAQTALAGDVERALGGIATSLAAAATELGVTADGLADGAERTAEEAAVAASGAAQASANVQTVAAAAEEMAASVAELARQVAGAAEVARQAASEAAATDGTVRRLADGAGRIDQVVRLIGDIAGQTNLLALNATIEAARAGEAGKGFAVVASEVKTLATQTARATEEISRQIAEMQAATGQAVTAIQSIGVTVGRSSEIAATIAASVEQQGAATREIARNVAEAAQGTNAVSAGVGQLSDGATQGQVALRGLRGATGKVALQGEALRVELDGLVARLRSSQEAA